MKYYLGVDIGGTAIKAGIVDENGKVMNLKDYKKGKYWINKE